MTTDGAPKMVGRNVGFVKLFTEVVGHPILQFHCIIHQEVLCAKIGLKELNDVLSIVTKVVNLISARALHKRQFSLLLNEVESAYSGLLMYNVHKMQRALLFLSITPYWLVQHSWKFLLLRFSENLIFLLFIMINRVAIKNCWHFKR